MSTSRIKPLVKGAVLLPLLLAFGTVGLTSLIAQVRTENNAPCSALLVKSAAKNVTLNCNINSRQIAALIDAVNKVLEKGNYSDPATAQIVQLLNDYIARGSSQQVTLMSLEPKIDKLIEFISTFENRPQDLAKSISQVSSNSISYTRISGPLTLQIVGVYRIKYQSGVNVNLQGMRFIFRLGLEGKIQPEYVVISLESGSKAEKWQALSDKGTACYFEVNSTGVALPMKYDFSSGHLLSEKYKLAPNEIPMTLVVNSVCPDFVEKDAVDVRIRLYYKMPSGSVGSAVSPANGWQVADFSFGAVTPSFYPTGS